MRDRPDRPGAATPAPEEPDAQDEAPADAGGASPPADAPAPDECDSLLDGGEMEFADPILADTPPADMPADAILADMTPADMPAAAGALADDAKTDEAGGAEDANGKPGAAAAGETGDGAGGEPDAGEEQGADADAGDGAAPTPEFSRLDGFLARITARAAATTAPSNDNLSAAADVAGQTTPSGAGDAAAAPEPADDAAPEPTDDAAREHGARAQDGDVSGGDGAERGEAGDAEGPQDDGAPASVPPEAAQPKPDTAAAARDESADEGMQAGPRQQGGAPAGSGGQAEEAGPAHADAGPGLVWPEGWGPPTGPNVLRVLGELMAKIERQPAAPEAAPAPPSPSDGAAADGQQAATPARPGKDAPPAPVAAPTRPVLANVSRRRDRSVVRRTVGTARSGRADPAPAMRGHHVLPNSADTATGGSAVPAPGLPMRGVLIQQAKRDLSPWILEQPEFQRAFAASALSESNVLADTAQGQAGAAVSRRWIRRAIALVAAGLVLGFAGVAGVGLYQSRVGEHAPAAAPAEPDETGTGSESLLPKAVLPGGEGRRVVQPIDTGNAAPGLGDFTTFSRASTNPGPKPTITIERSAVRPFASGSAGALAVSRLDALNVQAAKLISAYEIDKAAEIVEDILSRDPAHFGALLNRGRIGLLRDSFEAAHADFARARQVKPQSVAAALGESEALLGQRRGADALKIVEAAIAANPGEVAAYDLRARAHAQTGQGDQISVDCGELSWKLGLSYVGKWCEAMAYKDAGRTEDATAAFRAALEGASEEFVRHRQRYLKFRGHYPGDIDGQAGPATHTALAACAADARC